MRIMESGEIEIYGATGNRGLYSWNNPAGSNFRTYDETGYYPTISLEADGSGEGGFFTVRRNNSSTGFLVDGNNNGSQEPEVGIYGSSRSAVFDMNLSGDDSVDLPTDAVSASEMLDEPGVVSATSGVSTQILTTYTVLSSQTITAPASGYVLVLASSQAQIGHNTGVNSQIDFGVSATDASLPANQDVLYLIPSTSATGTYCIPITSHGLFEVSAGAHTFYYIGRKFADTYNAFSLDKQFTAIFIPTSYGSVMPTISAAGLDDDAVPQDNGMTSSEISDVRERSLDANNARIEAELAEMRAKIEALQAELDNPNR